MTDERRRIRVETISVTDGWTPTELSYDTKPGERVLHAQYEVYETDAYNRRVLHLVIEGPIPDDDE